MRHLTQAVQLLTNLEGDFRKEHRSIESFKEHLVGRLDTLEVSLAKAERGLTVLQTHWTKHRHTFEELVQKLAPTQQLAVSLDGCLSEMEQLQETAWNTLRELQEDVQGLIQNDAKDDDGEHSRSPIFSLR